MKDSDVIKLMKSPKEEIAFGLGYEVRGINLKYKESSVLLMVKVQGRLDGNKICFLEAADSYGCWCILASACYTTSFKIDWRNDNW